MKATTITLTGPHLLPARTPKAPRQEVLAQMRVADGLRVSAVAVPVGAHDEPGAGRYIVTDLLTDDELSTDDRDEALGTFRRMYLAARKPFRCYTLEHKAPEGATKDEALAAYLGMLNALSPAFTSYRVPKSGRRFSRIVQTVGVYDSAFAFVENATGRLMKAASWSGPSRTTYGNLTEVVTLFPA